MPLGEGETLGDRRVVAINHMALGNALRDDGRYVEALAVYEAAGVEGRAISRPGIDGRAARLAAACHNSLADNATGAESKEHAEHAIELARRAIGIFENSLGSHDHADAYDELGTALINIGREGERWEARARGVALFLAAGDLDNAHKLERQLAQMKPTHECRARILAFEIVGRIEQVLPAGLSLAVGQRAAVAELGNWNIQIVERPAGVKGFLLLPKRWIVERTFAWLLLAHLRLLSRRLARS